MKRVRNLCCFYSLFVFFRSFFFVWCFLDGSKKCRSQKVRVAVRVECHLLVSVFEYLRHGSRLKSSSFRSTVHRIEIRNPTKRPTSTELIGGTGTSGSCFGWNKIKLMFFVLFPIDASRVASFLLVATKVGTSSIKNRIRMRETARIPITILPL